MEEQIEIEFIEWEENTEYEELIKQVLSTCFKQENLENCFLSMSITLTNNETIRKINQEYREIDKATDVLSFPMLEKEEIEQIKEKKQQREEIFGDIIISIPKVEEQAREFGHSIQRELAYMLVHGFYHLMGYDHMTEEEKKQMREKEEIVLKKLNITRD